MTEETQHNLLLQLQQKVAALIRIKDAAWFALDAA
jgi:hypothetical protein